MGASEILFLVFCLGGAVAGLVGLSLLCSFAPRRVSWLICGECGYDLSGTPKTRQCPECGTQRTPKRHRLRGLEWLWAVILPCVMTFLAMCVICIAVARGFNSLADVALFAASGTLALAFGAAIISIPLSKYHPIALGLAVWIGGVGCVGINLWMSIDVFVLNPDSLGGLVVLGFPVFDTAALGWCLLTTAGVLLAGQILLSESD